ncbi:MAG: phage portal protein [Acidobacteria bacterium]|nr:MAG: phage portal protein [Acidobacteriota bacterium]
MTITNSLRGAMRRIAGVSFVNRMTQSGSIFAGGASAQKLVGKRRTVPLPSILNTYGPRAQTVLRPTPMNLRRFSETPVARRAINTIKDHIAGMRWRVQSKPGASQSVDAESRIRILTLNFAAPNPDDSFRSLAEQVLEDVIVGGFGTIEVEATGDVDHPLALWPVDGATIHMRADWDGMPSSIRYEQVTSKSGPNANILLADDELIYMRLNPRTFTPFGLGRLEVAFESINAFLGAHRYAGRLASNSVVEYALWLQNTTPEQHERLIRWWQDEIEGTGRVPILSVENKPEVLRFGGGTDADLRLQWQEFLLRIIADAFDLPPQSLGLERDVNRSTATEMNDQAFRQAIVPTARLFAEYLTRDAICKKLGWDDLEFVFTDVDGPGDAMEEAQIQQILIQSGVLTVNEVRQMRGLAPI